MSALRDDKPKFQELTGKDAAAAAADHTKTWGGAPAAADDDAKVDPKAKAKKKVADETEARRRGKRKDLHGMAGLGDTP